MVNGAIALIHTFNVTTAGALVRGVSSGFANYLGLDDMFTRTQLAGDQLRITIQQVGAGAGPYVVQGGYSYRSA